MVKKIELTINQKLGNYTISEISYINNRRKIKVRCQCGNEFFSTIYRIKNSSRCTKCKFGNFPGKEIGGCLLIEKISPSKWKMKCHCGKIYTNRPRFDRGKFRDCGCTANQSYIERAKKKIGKKFGKLQVVGVGKIPNHNTLICKCKCGNKIEFTNGHEFKRNSCGCLLKDNAVKLERKGNARFSNNEILSLRELWSTNLYSRKELCKMFEMSLGYLSRIINNRIWKDLK